VHVPRPAAHAGYRRVRWQLLRHGKNKRGEGLPANYHLAPMPIPLIRRPWLAVVQMEAITTATSKSFRRESVPSYVPALIN
jgi:hypothetical protein